MLSRDWTRNTENIVTVILSRFYFSARSIWSAGRDLIFFSSSRDFIPWNSAVAENVYLLFCSVHLPPFTKKENSSLCPEGTVTGVILSQFYLFYTKIQFNIMLSSLLYWVLPYSIFRSAVATDFHTHPICLSCTLLVPSVTSSICLALLYFVRNTNYDVFLCVHFFRHSVFLLSCFQIPLITQQCIYSGRVRLKPDGMRWRTGWEVKGKLANGWVASTHSHTTSERGVSSITNADAHTSADSSRLNWRLRRFKWTRPFRRKTKSGFCPCAITFKTHSTILTLLGRGD